MKRQAIILAAGKGTRMKTETPKCAFPILKKPMIEYSIESLERANVERVITVVGYKKDVFINLLGNQVEYVYQEEFLGTGDAVLQVSKLKHDKDTLTMILPGDMPLIPSSLIDKLYRSHIEMGNDLTVVSFFTDNPSGYGRIERNEYNQVINIIEERDCNDLQKQIKEVNSGTYIINTKLLFKILPLIKKNTLSGEYYLTDILRLMHQDYRVRAFIASNPTELMGINTLYQVSRAEGYLRYIINKNMMEFGVYMVNPDTITIGHNVVIEEGVTIYPNTTITGHTVVKSGSVIGPNTELEDAYIGNHSRVNHSLVYDSKIGNYTKVGPFSHIRSNSEIGDHNRIGNFVEIKKTKTDKNTKASHLSYIGDSTVGKNVNFGCGSITVNYDGISKHKTTIGNDVFIGCNVNLIAPISISDEVFIAAGSTVTKNIPKGVLAIARNKQVHKEEYYSNLLKPKSDNN
jgi:bifunctional UDP-N-acetylglucosamine pyrophosphorylase/glucosamine-1-phosphate N-acetyltransferase